MVNNSTTVIAFAAPVEAVLLARIVFAGNPIISAKLWVCTDVAAPISSGVKLLVVTPVTCPLVKVIDEIILAPVNADAGC